MRLFRFALFLLCIHELNAQCPITDFSMPVTACINQRITPINLSTGAVAYEWDFCSGDLENDPTASGIITNAFLVRGRSFRIVNSSTGWYGFSIDQVNNVLLRFDFGLTPSSTPIVTNLGNPGGLLQTVFDFELYLESGNWYALVVNATGNSIIKLSFGSNLSSLPVASSVVSLPDGPRGIALVNDQSNLHAFITTSLTSTITRLDFGNTINNSPQVNTILVPSAINLRGISFIKQCNSWFATTTDYNQNLVYLLDFSSGITNSPSSSVVSTGSVNLNFPASISLQQEGGKYFALIQSAIGNLYRLGFGANLSSTPQTSKDFGNFGVSSDNFPLAVANSQSSWMGFSIDNTNGRLIRLSFPNLCSGNIFVNTQSNPIFQYSNSGNYQVSLRSFDSSGNSSSIQNTIVISSLQSPDITFASQNSCVNNIVSFMPQNTSGNIAGYSWNFGDTNVSSQSNPTHIYSSATTYPVTLQVTASNGCTNTFKSDIAIYNQPIADFSLPLANPFCTNQNYLFTNQSTFDAASNPTWEWRLNGTLVSGSLNLTQPFTNSSAQEIRLKAKIPGCENEVIKNVSTVLTGPVTNFTFANSCQAASVAFTNTTSGSVTSYSWIFGDGNTSSSTNASNTYTNVGPYNVTLQANNAVGCQNSVTKLITIYSKPQPDFFIGLPPFSCSGSSSQFTDQTPLPTDSNIASYAWSFGDAANGTSNFKNPLYTFSAANNYNVSLLVTTNFGCTNSIQKSVTIAQSPLASFSNLPACVNQATQFTDASTGNIKSRLWQIQGSTFITPNPQFTFSGPGSFPVVLTVTGNNKCVAQASKVINVPIPPSLDFTAEAPCATMNTIFTEVTSTIDPSISQAWAFGSQANGNGSPTQYSFSTPNNYSVRLSSTRQSGCVYSLSKNISIVNAPVADFSPSIDAGEAPLSVTFANNSIFANSYQWKFGDKDNSTSLQVNPSFVFSDLGNFNVELAASNSVGCSNKLIKIINVVVPRIDMIMSDFFFTTDNTNALQPVVTIVNKSNVLITDPVILIDVAGGSSVKKKIIGTLKPNQELTQMLDFQIVPGSIGYICAEVDVAGNTNLFQNRKCLSLQGSEVIFAPFPNPTKVELNLDWINAGGSSVSFQIFNSKGSVCLEQSFTNLSQGINRLTVNTSSLSPGIYVIRFSDSKTTQSHKFAVADN